MRTGRAIGIMTLLNVVNAAVGITYTVLVAYYFGTSRVLEIYFAAAAVQVSLVQFIQLGQMTEIFLPVYHRLKKSLGPVDAFAAFSVLLNWVVVIAVLASGMAWLFAPILMHLRIPGFSASDIDLSVEIFRWCLPLLAVQIVNGLAATLANAEKWFGVPEALQVAGRVLGLVSVAGLAPSLNVWALVAGLALSNLLPFVGFIFITRKLGYRHRLSLRHSDFSVVKVFRQLLTTFSYVGAVQVYGFVFDAALSTLPQGVFAVFKYVTQITAKAEPMVMRPVSVVFFTQFSTSFAAGASNLRKLAETALARMLAISAVVFVTVFTAGEPLLAALWGPRRFGVDEVKLAATLLTLVFAVSIISGFAQISRKVGATLGLVQAMYFVGGCSRLAAALLAWFLIDIAGTYGAIAAFVIANVVTNCVFALPTFITRREYFVWYESGLLLRWGAAVAAACLGGTIFAEHLPLDWTGSRLYATVAGIAIASVSLTALLAFGALLRIREVTDTARRLRRLRLRSPRPS